MGHDEHTAAIDHALAGRLAAESGRLLLALRARIDEGADPDEVRAAGDRESHEHLAAELARVQPGDAVLSEEGVDDAARLTAERIWIVDPLDGTREFGEPPRDDWAVHVALVVEGELRVGAVALPARGMVLSTARPPELAAPVEGPIRLVVSRSRPPAWTEPVAAELGAELVPLGSAGAKAMAVVLGAADAYVHAGGQYEWDSAAPVAVARAAGLHASRIDGSDLVYNQADPLLPDLVICRPEIAERVLAAVAAQLG